MHTAKLTLIPLALALAAACTPTTSGDDYKAVLPDDRVEVNLKVADTSSARVGEWSEYYLTTAQVTTNVNDTAVFVLGILDTVTAYPPSVTAQDNGGTQAAWGPWDGGALDPTSSMLYVAKDADGAYTWAIQQRPKNDDTADWTVIVNGQIEAGATEQASRGAFGIDYSAASVLNPNVDAVGQFVLTYDIGTEGVTGQAAFANFITDNGNPGNAVYNYQQVYDGNGAMDLGIEADMETTTSAKEDLVIRSRWVASGAGRSDAYAFGGDIGSFVGQASDCWGTDFKTAYYIDNFTDGGMEEGDATACAYATPEYDDTGLDNAQP